MRIKVFISTVLVMTASVLAWSLWWYPAGAQETEPASRSLTHRTETPPAQKPTSGNLGLAENVTPRAPNLVRIVARHPNGEVFYDQRFGPRNGLVARHKFAVPGCVKSGSEPGHVDSGSTPTH